MLVLRRNAGEKVMIGPDVEMTVVRFEGSTVVLGFVAPGNITIDRREVFLQKRAGLGPVEDTAHLSLAGAKDSYVARNESRGRGHK